MSRQIVDTDRLGTFGFDGKSAAARTDATEQLLLGLADPERTFITTLLARPDDVAVRAVYADWLEETGHPDQAEFVRLGAELVGIKDLPRKASLFGRAAAMAFLFDSAWVEIVAPDLAKPFM